MGPSRRDFSENYGIGVYCSRSESQLRASRTRVDYYRRAEMSDETYYIVLNARETASASEIKTAYRDLASLRTRRERSREAFVKMSKQRRIDDKRKKTPRYKPEAASDAQDAAAIVITSRLPCGISECNRLVGNS